MWTLAWLGIASLCLGTSWAVPAKERRKAEKPKAHLALYENLDLDNYDLTLDNYGEILDLSNYEELYDYGDLAPKIEVGTLAPRPKDPVAPPDLGATAGTPKLQLLSTAGPVPPAPAPAQEKLKRIDLSSNSISRADADAFRLLPSLQELILPENRLTALPELPRSIMRLDARLNSIPSAGLRPEAFRDLKQLQFLHLSDNQLDYIPAPLPESLRSLHLQNNNIQTMHEDTFCDSQDHSQVRRALEDIRLDGNPINLSLFPNAYFCLPRLPTGRFF
ncbi:opticin isoform X3 [Patagioenas fasciata]|uniref:opticin isoform X3 n=1 Tax=Patagioenas fasciata TaxID=372321 RepID=UPI003A99A102